MYLKKLEQLSRYLVENDLDSNGISRFINFEILGYLQCRAIIFAELSDDGHLQSVDSFGFTKEAIESWGAFPLTLDVPVTAAVKQNACIHVKSPDDLYEKFPVMKQIKNIDHDWGSILAVPIHAFGVYSITSFLKPELDEDHEQFLRAVGQLAAVAFTKATILRRVAGRIGRSNNSRQGVELTPRQEMIRKFILKGLTNQEIAHEIGFSDSLVRQETIEIYAILNVSGRKELISNSSKN